MKRNFSSLLFATLAGLSMASCSMGNVPTESSVPTSEPTSEQPTVNLTELKAKATTELNALFGAFDKNAYEVDVVAIVEQMEAYASTFVANATTAESLADAVATVKSLYSAQMAKSQKYASGVQSFVASSYAERTEILAILEAYAYKHFLTGFSMIDDGGYQLYSKTVKRGVETYVPGYGWATLSDGEIVADLSGETKDEWKRYYHSYETSDPKQINYADDKGSVVGDLIGYCASSYWGTRLNETNDGYEWYSELAKEKPVAVDANATTGLSTKYKWKLKTGADGLKYDTLTSNSALAAFKGRSVAAEDYITPYQMYYTKALGWARSAENLTGAGSIKGAAAYYNASGEGFSQDAWDKVGIKVTQEGNDYVMSVEFNTPCTPFYAMYYMSSSMFSPVPKEFITTLGGLKDAGAADKWSAGASIWGKTYIDKSLSPVDTWLSLGAYTIEAWTPDKEIVFKRNPEFTACGEDRYKIAGVHFNILEAAATDNEAAWKEFNAGKLSSCGVPSTQKQDRTRNDELAYAVYTPGSSNYKLNVNTCTKELWEQLFGKDGTISQEQDEEKYWNVKPCMSNENFLLGLSWALDRETLAASLGRGPSINYFGDGYLSDPENGVVYNTTDAHKQAMAALTQNGAYPMGYNLEVAKAYFETACEEMIANGDYKKGDTIKIEIAWQTNSQFTNYGDPIIEMWESAFNAVGEEYGLTLDVTNWAGAVWHDVYYKKMMVGQFDIGFGSISGNTLNPINFLEVLKSDNSSGFTLNWGADTSEVNLEYKGMLWSFDSLWQAADTGAYFEHGVVKPAYAADMKRADDGKYATDCYKKNQDGTGTAIINTNALTGVDGLTVDVESVVLNGYRASGYTEYDCEFTYNKETGELVVTIPAAVYETLLGDDNDLVADYGGHFIMFDITYANTYNEVPSSELETVGFIPEKMNAAE